MKNENEVYPCLEVAEQVLDVLAQSELNENDRLRVIDVVRSLASEPLVKRQSIHSHLVNPSASRTNRAVN